jgi:hypothetical protein
LVVDHFSHSNILGLALLLRLLPGDLRASIIDSCQLV